MVCICRYFITSRFCEEVLILVSICLITETNSSKPSLPSELGSKPKTI